MDDKITGDLGKGAKYAEGCRTSKANSEHMEPPKGPVKEATLTNGMDKFKEKNISRGNKY